MDDSPSIKTLTSFWDPNGHLVPDLTPTIAGGASAARRSRARRSSRSRLTPRCCMLLAPLGQHERALQLLAAEDPALALQYCDAHYCDAHDAPHAVPRGSPRVFDMLLAAYLQPPAGDGPQLAQLAPVRGQPVRTPRCTCITPAPPAAASACSPRCRLGRTATSPPHVPLTHLCCPCCCPCRRSRW